MLSSGVVMWNGSQDYPPLTFVSATGWNCIQHCNVIHPHYNAPCLHSRCTIVFPPVNIFPYHSLLVYQSPQIWPVVWNAFMTLSESYNGFQMKSKENDVQNAFNGRALHLSLQNNVHHATELMILIFVHINKKVWNIVKSHYFWGFILPK